jgi:hypothetical protein
MEGVRLEGGGTHEAKVQYNLDPFGFGSTHRHFSHHPSDDFEKITFHICPVRLWKESKQEVIHMKTLSAKVGIMLLVVGLTLCSGIVWGADWRELAEATTGVFQYDAQSVSSSPQGIVKVWIYNATKREGSFIELNCNGKTYHVLDVVQYDEARRVANRNNYYDNPTWLNISPGSVPEALQKFVCR